MRIRRTFAFAAVAMLVSAGACAQDSADDVSAEPKDGPAITVGSANFPEAVILAEIYAQALEAEGFEVDTKLNIGAREIYFPALEKGDVDLLPEYTGSLLSFLTKQEVTASSDPEEAYEQLTEALQEREGVVALEPSDAEDKDGIVANQQTAEEHDLTTISDLEGVSEELVLGGPPECPTRQACLKGLKEVYGLEFKEFKPLDVGGPQTVTLLKSNEIQLANLFTTDSRIAANDFVVLEDDKGIVGAENVVPVVREEIVDAYGEDLTAVLNEISAALTTDGLTELNRQVDVDKQDPEDVAAEWLREEGLL